MPGEEKGYLISVSESPTEEQERRSDERAARPACDWGPASSSLPQPLSEINEGRPGAVQSP